MRRFNIAVVGATGAVGEEIFRVLGEMKFPVNNVFREDVVVNGDDRENILKNAPEQKDGAFVVPKTFEE